MILENRMALIFPGNALRFVRGRPLKALLFALVILFW